MKLTLIEAEWKILINKILQMYYGYSTWDYINGRVMTINRCWNGMPQDMNTTFRWTPGQLIV